MNTTMTMLCTSQPERQQVFYYWYGHNEIKEYKIQYWQGNVNVYNVCIMPDLSSTVTHVCVYMLNTVVQMFTLSLNCYKVLFYYDIFIVITV